MGGNGGATATRGCAAAGRGSGDARGGAAAGDHVWRGAAAGGDMRTGDGAAAGTGSGDVPLAHGGAAAAEGAAGAEGCKVTCTAETAGEASAADGDSAAAVWSA